MEVGLLPTVLELQLIAGSEAVKRWALVYISLYVLQ